MRALGADNVLGVALPTRYSSEHSLRDARELAQNLGIAFREISIEGIFASYLAELTPHLDALGAASANDVTFENIQARIRGNVLMAVANRFSSRSIDEIIASGLDAEVVKRIVKLVKQNEYKCRQMPPGLVLTSKAFGFGRRMPVAQRYWG